MKKKFISNFLTIVASIIFLILMFFNTVLVFTKTALFPTDYQETLYYSNDSIILNIAITVIFGILLLLLFRFLVKIINIKRLVLLVMVYAFIMSFLFALLRRDYVQFDPFNVIDQASNFLRSNYSGLDKGENYLYIYSHQITTVFIFQIILGLFGRATFLLYIMQCFAISYIIYMLYKISDAMFGNEEVNYFTVILSGLCFPLIFYVAFIYGILLGMFFVLLSFYLFIKYIKESYWYNLVLLIFSINLSILLIGNNLINMLSIFVVAIIILIKKFDKKIILFIAATLIVMLGTKSIIYNYYEISSGKNIPEGIHKISWIAMGMQEGDREAGWWNAFNYDVYVETDYDNKKVIEISKNSINQRLEVFKNNPNYAISFYKRKYYNQFLDPSFQSLLVTAPVRDLDDDNLLLKIKNEVIKEIYFGKINNFLNIFMKVFQIFVYLFTFLASFKIVKKRDVLLLLIPISFIGGTIFHMIWEAKSRYLFPYFVFLIPLSAYGFVYFKNFLIKKFLTLKEYS